MPTPPPRPPRPSKKAVAAAIRTLERAKAYLTDEELDELLQPIYDDIPDPPPPPVPPKPRPGTHRYRAEFTIHPDRGPYSISAAADLTPEQVRRFSPWVGETMLLADDRAGVLAEAFDWAQTRENHLSAGGDLRFDLLEQADELALLALRAGAFDVEGRPIRDSTAGRPQPHVAGPAGRWFEGGEVLSRRFDSTGSCLTVAAYEFIDPIAHKRRKKRHPAFASLAAFYEFATGKKVREGEPMPMTLRELYKALAKWKVPCRVVDAGNRLVAKYDPETVSPRASTLRLAFKNSHCWVVPAAEWKAFDQVVSGKDVATDALPCRDLTASLSPHWRQPAKDPTPTLALVNDAASVLEVLEQARIAALDEELQGPTTIRIACRCEPADLLVALREDQGLPCNLEAAYIRAVHGNPDSFALRYGKLDVRVSRAVGLQQRTDDQLPVGFDSQTDLENVHRFEAAFTQVRAALCPPVALSSYSPGYQHALGTYHRGARCGWLNEACRDDVTYAAFDIGRAYTGFAAEIRQIPVLSSFDDFRPYVAGTPVQPTSSYLVRCASPDGILFDRTEDHVQGFTVLYARACGIPCTIVGVLDPHRLEKCEVSAALKALYADPDLPDAHRKAIGCVGYGQAVKRFNRQQRGEVFGDKEEALAHGGDVRPIGSSSWLSLKSGKKAMVDGYTPVGAIILDKMRIVLHRMVAAIEGAGVAAAAVRTDCVYVRQEDQERAAAALRAASFTFACDVPADAPLWNKKVGVVRTELKDGALLPPSPLSTGPAVSAAAPTPGVRPAPSCTRITLRSETHAGWDKAELDALWPTCAADEVDQVVADLQGESRSALAFEGLVPGCGKSFASEDREARFAEGCLTVSPWNRLRCEKGGVTLHKLLGRGVGEADGDRMKPYDLTGVRRVHFEEPYLYTVRELEWMAAFMRKHGRRGVAFTMAGDPGQLRPVNQKLAIDPDAYYEQIFAHLFPRRVTLRYSKRTRTAEEGARMEALCADLRAEDSPVPVILQRHGLRVVDFTALGEADAGGPHVAALRATCDRVNSWAHGLVGGTALDKYAEGQQLLGRKGGRVQGGRISPNELYTVTRVGDRLVLATQDGGVRSPTLAQARALLGRPYCATGHATQGLSLGNRLFIHDYDSFMADHRWMRTVVSRCSTLDITLVRHGAPRPAVPPQQLARRIALHRDSDTARGFHWDEADYVTPAWAYRELERQGHRCACHADLSEDWSIDRITNQRPHTVGNCRIVCRACQHASAHRL